MEELVFGSMMLGDAGWQVVDLRTFLLLLLSLSLSAASRAEGREPMKSRSSNPSECAVAIESGLVRKRGPISQGGKKQDGFATQHESELKVIIGREREKALRSSAGELVR